jgi:serine/threonine protein phosphatase 1
MKMSSRRFVIGDIHGAHKALIQCFERSQFDRQHDMLISLGDLCDRWPDTSKVFDELLTVRNLVLILGNHDEWALQWFLSGATPDIWMIQGGSGTVKSWKYGVPEAHVQLLQNALLYYELDNKLFVHGGIIPGQNLASTGKDVLLWNRSLVTAALALKKSGLEKKLTGYDEIYVGHTPTINFIDDPVPIKACEVYMLDTGAAWPGGVLTMMDMDTKECFSSDLVTDLYRDRNPMAL